MNTIDCGQDPGRGRQRHRMLRAAVVVALATMTAGCADYGRGRNAWQGAGAQPQMRALPLTVSGTDSAQAYYVLGRYRYFNGDLAGAEQAYRTAATLDPRDPEPLNGLGVLYDRLAQFERSAIEYKAALDRAPDAPHILANLGYSLLLQGRSEEALGPLRRAVELAPGNAVARSNLARAESATALASGRQPGSAAESDAAVGPTANPATAVALVEPVPHPASPIAIVTDVLSGKNSNATSIVRSVVGAAPPAAPRAQDIAAVAVAPPAAAIVPPMVASVQGAEVRQVVALGALFAGVRVELSNGNGVTGMAKGLRTRLNGEGLKVARVTNSLPYDTRQTTIICAASLSDQASALARQLSGSPRIVFASVQHRNVDLRVILGRDAVPNAKSPA